MMITSKSFAIVSLQSDEGDRGAPGAGGAAELREGEDEGELAHVGGGELRGVEVLDDEHAVPDVQRLRNLERAGRVLGRHRTVAPRVAAGERDAAVDEPGGEVEAGAGLAGEVGRRVVPVGAPAGVEEHGVARLRLDPGDVGGGDD